MIHASIIAIASPPLLPELRHYAATEVTPLWEATEAELDSRGLPPPYWAFAWAGGQALARWLLDNPAQVAGKTVLSFACGGGLEAIAAARCGAAEVAANDIDAFARTACALNAELNGVSLRIFGEDLLAQANAPKAADIVMAGDVCYERPFAEAAIRWLRGQAAAGALVLLGDPGRSYLPKEGLSPVARYAAPTSRAIEDTDVRDARVWRVSPLL